MRTSPFVVREQACSMEKVVTGYVVAHVAVEGASLQVQVTLV